MLTVLEAIKLSDDYLKKYGVESSRLNAELLLAEILKCKRLDLYLLYDRPLNDSEISTYREFIKRRSQREPLQYIIGHVEFYGIELSINPSVLIPRPETEIIVESILKSYDSQAEIRLLDIGIGSGNISVALLKNLPNASAVGIDISSEAISIAKLNACSMDLLNKLNLIRFDILEDDITKLGKFDLIVSNPPYISVSEYECLEPELRVYEPANSLTDYGDGYKFYKKIISASKVLLNSSGKLFLELGKGQSDTVNDLMTSSGFRNICIIKDYSQIERVISGEL